MDNMDGCSTCTRYTWSLSFQNMSLFDFVSSTRVCVVLNQSIYLSIHVNVCQKVHQTQIRTCFLHSLLDLFLIGQAKVQSN